MSDDLKPRVAFTEALAAFQSELPSVGKDQKANTGTYSYSYADLTSIHEAALPLLTKHGFAFTAAPTVRDDGTFVLRYALRHEGGHEEGGDFPLPAQATSQQIGSSITYARRYCFCAITGIAPGGEDDDGARASETQIAVRDPGRTRGQTRRHQPAGPQDDEWTTPAPDLGAVYRLAGEKGIRANDAFAQQFGGLHPKSATPEQLADFVAWLEQQEAQS